MLCSLLLRSFLTRPGADRSAGSEGPVVGSRAVGVAGLQLITQHPFHCSEPRGVKVSIYTPGVKLLETFTKFAKKERFFLSAL